MFPGILQKSGINPNNRIKSVCPRYTSKPNFNQSVSPFWCDLTNVQTFINHEIVKSNALSQSAQRTLLPNFRDFWSERRSCHAVSTRDNLCRPYGFTHASLNVNAWTMYANTIFRVMYATNNKGPDSWVEYLRAIAEMYRFTTIQM